MIFLNNIKYRKNNAQGEETKCDLDEVHEHKFAEYSGDSKQSQAVANIQNLSIFVKSERFLVRHHSHRVFQTEFSCLPLNIYDELQSICLQMNCMMNPFSTMFSCPGRVCRQFNSYQWTRLDLAYHCAFRP